MLDDSTYIDRGAGAGNFELQGQLRISSPGVVPRPNPVEVYRLISTDDDGGWLVRTSG